MIRSLLLRQAAAAACAVLLGTSVGAGEPRSPLRLRVLPGESACPGRVELAIEGVPPAENPFDPEEIAVDARVTAPGGRTARIPAFFSRGYRRKLEDGHEVLTPSGEEGWRIRLAIRERGAHVVRATARVRGALRAEGRLRFEARKAAPAGFVQVEPSGKRYFQADDSSPLFINGICACWHDARGTFDYDDWLAAYQEAGMNYIRIWMWPHAFSIEWDRNDRLRYRLDNAWRLDYVLDEADRRGVFVMLCLDYHGILEVKPGFWGGNNYWPRHPYNAANGGPCRTQNDFFTSAEARRLYLKRLRYVVARWSAFRNILAWQFFNEIDNVYRYLEPADVAAWHRDMGRELRALDPYNHLITTSLTGRSERREIWELPEMDFAQYHSYNEKHPADVTERVVQRFHKRYGKPVFVGEYGTDFRGWKPATDPHLRALHQAIWSGAFTGAAGTGMSWWWQSIHKARRYASWASLAAFLRPTGIGRAGMGPARVEVKGGPEVKVFAIAGKQEALAWLLDPRFSWPDGAMEKDPPEARGVQVDLLGLQDGAYRLEWWDPSGGRKIRTRTARCEGGRLRLSPPAFRIDTAVRIQPERKPSAPGDGRVLKPRADG